MRQSRPEPQSLKEKLRLSSESRNEMGLLLWGVEVFKLAKSSFTERKGSSYKEWQPIGCGKWQRFRSKMLRLQPCFYDFECHSSSVWLPLKIWGTPEQKLPAKVYLPSLCFYTKDSHDTAEQYFHHKGVFPHTWKRYMQEIKAPPFAAEGQKAFT